MLKKMLLPLMIVPLFLACGKQEPPAPAAPSAPQTAAPAPAPAPEAAAPAPQAAPSAAAPATTGGDTAKGETIYKQTCFACHAAGVAGAPKLGDKAAWAPRIAQGIETMYTHSIKGFQGKLGMMPAKGGNTALTDAEVKAAVDYMVAQSK